MIDADACLCLLAILAVIVSFLLIKMAADSRFPYGEQLPTRHGYPGRYSLDPEADMLQMANRHESKPAPSTTEAKPKLPPMRIVKR